MNLRDRLAELQRQAGARPPAPGASPPDAQASGNPTSTLRDRLARLSGARARGLAPASTARATSAELAARAGGELIADGLIRIERDVPLDSQRGGIPLANLRHPVPLPGGPDIKPEQHVYLDTETTGLSGGSGTLAFLVGLARVRGERLRVTQWLLTRFVGEATLLAELTSALEPADHLVTYNGRSFDAPLLATRLRMHGLRDPLPALGHLDLLHPMRRLFAASWPDCRLTSVEARLLGYRRRDDLPGSEVPQAWFDWLNLGAIDRLVQVTQHNCEDLVSLAASHVALGHACRAPTHPDLDLHALASWISGSDPERARSLLASRAQALDARALGLLARLHRRAGDWRAAVAIWHRLAAEGCQTSLEHLAKYHEHHLKDYATALSLGARLDRSPQTLRRIERLRGKIESALL